MEIQTTNKFCIITPLSPKLDSRESKRLEEEILLHNNHTIGLDLSYADDCTIDFLKMAQRLQLSIFNIPSEIFSLITMMNLDKIINLYTTEEDFLNNQHRLLNRKFCII